MLTERANIYMHLLTLNRKRSFSLEKCVSKKMEKVNLFYKRKSQGLNNTILRQNITRQLLVDIIECDFLRLAQHTKYANILYGIFITEIRAIWYSVRK